MCSNILTIFYKLKNFILYVNCFIILNQGLSILLGSPTPNPITSTHNS